MYPSDSLISVLCTLQRFAELGLPNIGDANNVLENMSRTVLPYMLKCPALQCDDPSRDIDHVKRLCVVILDKFLRPILTNYASNVTERQQTVKNLKKKTSF